MYKVAVLGDKESILGFSAIGIDIFPVYDANEAIKTLRELEKDNYGIIYITEKLSLDIKDEIESYRPKIIPAIITIPGNSGSLNIGINRIREFAKKAVGIDIVFKDE